MTTHRIEIDCSRIVDRDSFHDCFADAFGFPEWYGRNMDASIDCMEDLDGGGMTRLDIKEADKVVLCLKGSGGLKSRCPELWEDLSECCAFVNWSRQEGGREPYLLVSAET